MSTQPFVYRASAMIVENTIRPSLLLLIEQSVARSITIQHPGMEFMKVLGFRSFQGRLIEGAPCGFDEALSVSSVQSGSQHVIVPIPVCDHTLSSSCHTCRAVSASMAALFQKLNTCIPPVSAYATRARLLDIGLGPRKGNMTFSLEGQLSVALVDWLLAERKREGGNQWVKTVSDKMQLMFTRLHPGSSMKIQMEIDGRAVRITCIHGTGNWWIKTESLLRKGESCAFHSHGFAGPGHQLIVLAGLAELCDIAARGIGPHVPTKAVR